MKIIYYVCNLLIYYNLFTSLYYKIIYSANLLFLLLQKFFVKILRSCMNIEIVPYGTLSHTTLT